VGVKARDWVVYTLNCLRSVVEPVFDKSLLLKALQLKAQAFSF